MEAWRNTTSAACVFRSLEIESNVCTHVHGNQKFKCIHIVYVAGSPMVGTPINLVQRPISPGLIKDLWIKPLCPKPMALGSIPGSSTFLSCPFTISEVFGRNGLIQRSLIRPGLIGLWTKLIGLPTIGLPAVISLRFLMIATIRS